MPITTPLSSHPKSQSVNTQPQSCFRKNSIVWKITKIAALLFTVISASVIYQNLSSFTPLPCSDAEIDDSGDGKNLLIRIVPPEAFDIPEENKQHIARRIVQVNGRCHGDLWELIKNRLEMAQEFSFCARESYHICTPLMLPDSIQRNLLNFWKENRPQEQWNCGDLMKGAYGLPFDKDHTIWGMEKQPFHQDQIQPGNVVQLYNSFDPVGHFGIYLGKSLYLSKLGIESLSVHTLEEMKRIYPHLNRIQKIKPTHPIRKIEFTGTAYDWRLSDKLHQDSLHRAFDFAESKITDGFKFVRRDLKAPVGEVNIVNFEDGKIGLSIIVFTPAHADVIYDYFKAFKSEPHIQVIEGKQYVSVTGKKEVKTIGSILLENNHFPSKQLSSIRAFLEA